MPEMRNYRVTQTREVEVTANELSDALLIADAAFTNGQTSDGTIRTIPNLKTARLEGVWGNAKSLIKETALDAERIS